MTSILSIDAAQRLDSRGNPTVQCTVTTDNGTYRSIVPSGASKGDYEAVELRDADPAKYHGKGVLTAVSNIKNTLGPKITEKGFKLPGNVHQIDEFMIELDGTGNKGKLGANAILAVSMAVWRAAAGAKGVPLYQFFHEYSGSKEPYVMPVPFFNVLNGGMHSGNTMAFQEFMIAPTGATSMAEAVQMGAEVYQTLKKVVTDKYGPEATGVGDEGGFAPPISLPNEALDLLTTAIETCNYTGRVKIGIDPASSEFFLPNEGLYDLAFKESRAAHTGSTSKVSAKTREQMQDLYLYLLDKYPIVLLEDPFAQDDWQAWINFHRHCPVELVGDDLLATNAKRITLAHGQKACNGLLLKINQIGTVSEAVAAAKQAFGYTWSVFVSHRSGESTDDLIADLVVGIRAGHIKAGAPCRGERVAKYNRLMDIEEEIRGSGGKCVYAGERFWEASSM